MGEYLNKEKSLFERDEKGELLGVEVELEDIKDKPLIRIKPMTRGKLQRIYADSKGGITNTDQDVDIIIDHCIEPKFNNGEIKVMRPKFSSSIVTAIVAESLGLSQDEIRKMSAEQAVKTSEDYLKKS